MVFVGISATIFEQKHDLLSEPLGPIARLIRSTTGYFVPNCEDRDCQNRDLLSDLRCRIARTQCDGYSAQTASFLRLDARELVCTKGGVFVIYVFISRVGGTA
jgi:hypothetical protein